MGYHKEAVHEYMQHQDWNSIVEDALDEFEGHDKLKDNIRQALWEYGEKEWNDSEADRADALYEYEMDKMIDDTRTSN